MSRLAEGEGALVDVSAAMAARDGAALRGALEAAARARLDPSALEEALLQGYLFLGYPVALGALALWREVSGVPSSPGPLEDPASWDARGEEVCRRVYGVQYDALRERVRTLHPDLEKWMVAEGYGKVLGRPGLELRVRELCIVGMLAVLGAARQLHSHLRGALNVGADPEEVEDALARSLRWADAATGELARRTWHEVLLRWRAKEEGSGGV